MPETTAPSNDIQMDPVPASTGSYANLPQKKSSSKVLGSSCREILSEIRWLTFVINDTGELEDLKADLQSIQHRLMKVAPSDGGLQVERGETQPKKRKLQNPDRPDKKNA